MIYFDTSALAKKYIKEQGSNLINKITKEMVVATSKITYPEMLSAFVRRNKTGDISNDKLNELINEFVLPPSNGTKGWFEIRSSFPYF